MKKDLEEKIHQFALQMHLDGYLCGYDKGRADVLDTIRAEIIEDIEKYNDIYDDTCHGLRMALDVIDKYRAESEDKK